MPHIEDYEQRRMRWIDAQANASAEVVDGLFNVIPNIREYYAEHKTRSEARMKAHPIIWTVAIFTIAILAHFTAPPS